MFDYALVISLSWFVLIVVWIASAVTAKRSIHGSWWRRFIYVRIVLAIVVILIFTHLPLLSRHVLVFEYLRPRTWGSVFLNPAVRAAGAILCVAGIALALWARAYLGRNWGMPMSRKADPELVTGGPYAFIRHPIYAGIILALVGSFIAQSVIWVVPLVIYSAFFLYSAPVEEKIMNKQFPDSYPSYKKRTKMLIPFVF